MRHRSRPFAKAGLIACAPALALALGGASPPASGGDVTVTVTDLRKVRGNINACITSDRKAFPDCGKHSGQLVVKVTGNSATFTFNDVPSGTYGISVLHDENANGKMDNALGMMPKEGYGFSRDAKVRMGPPKFKDAAFTVSGKGQSQTIRMRYML